MQRTRHPVVRVIPFILLLTPAIRADITAVSLNQFASSSVGPGFFGTPPDSDQLTNTAFPPVTLQVESVGGVSSDRTISGAGIVITNYSGPMSAGASTPGLSVSGSTYFGGSGPLSWSAGATLYLRFDLDQSQPFSFTGTFPASSQQLYFARIGGGTSISAGSSGMLLPGSYELSAGHFPSNFNLVITPEPAFASIIGLATALILPRRRTTGRNCPAPRAGW
jgi:hypothetical protein